MTRYADIWSRRYDFLSTHEKRSNFTGSLGFVLAAAGSAVGLGNIWRFPYLAAKGGGGVFIFVYIILALTFGFTLLTTEIAIGRKTAQGPLTAYGKINKNWRFIGFFAWLVPIIILPYYCTIGGVFDGSWHGYCGGRVFYRLYHKPVGAAYMDAYFPCRYGICRL